MGNIELQNPDNYYICINMIGNDMECVLSILNTRNIFNRPTRQIIGNFRMTIFDYFDYVYYKTLNFQEQTTKIFNKFKEMKGALDLNFRECLVVRVKNKNSPEISEIFENINNLNRSHYMPLVLFLLDEYDNDNTLNNSLTKIIPDPKKYSKIDSRMIYTESFSEIYNYYKNNKKIVNNPNIYKKIFKIQKILQRFCSYHNELGDVFSIISANNVQIKYDLREKKYDHTSNFCCIGRFGKGKSTGVNCILGEKKAKESKSGTSATKKINFYQANNCPIKIIDIPGFESNETINNAVQKFRELSYKYNNYDFLTAILYFVKSTDERMFAELEYKMFKEIIKYKNVPILYILTHANEKMDKFEIYDMLNTGIKGVISRHPEESEIVLKQIMEKMKANEKNCVFVNFYPEDDEPIFGIDEFFGKIQSLCV